MEVASTNKSLAACPCSLVLALQVDQIDLKLVEFRVFPPLFSQHYKCYTNLNQLILSFYSGIVLEKVAEYFYYNYKNRNREDVPDMEIPPELCLELLMAADYLDSK